MKITHYVGDDCPGGHRDSQTLAQVEALDNSESAQSGGSDDVRR